MMKTWGSVEIIMTCKLQDKLLSNGYQLTYLLTYSME